MILIDFIKSHENWRELLANKPYCVRTKEKDNYVLFSYTMGESDMNDPLVRVCRGIIINLATMEIVCRPFDKFFNWGEQQAAVLGNNIRAEEKVDGSLFKLWFDRRWHLSTNGMIDASEAELPLQTENVRTFADLFYEGWVKANANFADLDEEWTYMFELVSPFNRIVVPYPETELYFLGVRHNRTGEERNCREWGTEHGFKVPQLYPISTLKEAIGAAQKLDENHEGFVLVDENFNRVKVKGGEYLALHVLRDTTVSDRDILTLVLQGNQDDLTGSFPEYSEVVRDIEDKVAALRAEAEKELNEADFSQERREFALEVKDWQFSALLFQVYGGKPKEEVLEQMFSVANIEKIYKLIK